MNRPPNPQDVAGPAEASDVALRTALATDQADLLKNLPTVTTSEGIGELFSPQVGLGDLEILAPGLQPAEPAMHSR